MTSRTSTALHLDSYRYTNKFTVKDLDDAPANDHPRCLPHHCDVAVDHIVISVCAADRHQLNPSHKAEAKARKEILGQYTIELQRYGCLQRAKPRA